MMYVMKQSICRVSGENGRWLRKETVNGSVGTMFMLPIIMYTIQQATA